MFFRAYAAHEFTMDFHKFFTVLLRNRFLSSHIQYKDMNAEYSARLGICLKILWIYFYSVTVPSLVVLELAYSSKSFNVFRARSILCGWIDSNKGKRFFYACASLDLFFLLESLPFFINYSFIDSLSQNLYLQCNKNMDII